MSKRLQVVFDEAELSELRDAASRAEMSVSEWVRRTLREARRNEPQGGIDSKLRAVRAAARHSFPTADIDEMLAEVERGYASPAPE